MQAGLALTGPGPAVRVSTGQRLQPGLAQPSPSAADPGSPRTGHRPQGGKAAWRARIPPAAANRAQAAHGPAVSPVPASAPAQTLAPATAPSGPSNRAPRAHPTTAQPRLNRTQAPPRAPRERPALAGSQSPASAQANRHPARTPGQGRGASRNRDTRARPAEPSAPDLGPAARRDARAESE
jgi:translation initiation factor IF-2